MYRLGFQPALSPKIILITQPHQVMFTSLLFALCPYVSALPDTLGTAEVTAARRVAGISASAPVQRIDSAAITLRGITDMGDAMRRFAGVNLRDYGGAGGLKTILSLIHI